MVLIDMLCHPNGPRLPNSPRDALQYPHGPCAFRYLSTNAALLQFGDIAESKRMVMIVDDDR